MTKPSRFEKIDSIFLDGVEWTGFRKKGWLEYYSELVAYWLRTRL